MLYRACAIFYTMAALISIGRSAPGPVSDGLSISPCAAFFDYESAEKLGQRTGNLLAKSKENLYGIWIRLIFDRDVEKVVVAGFDVVSPEGNPKEVLVKNRNELLKADQPLSLKITVFYEGDLPPTLVEYRLNAKRMCSISKSLLTDFFEGDTDYGSFLSELQTNSKQIIPEQTYKCGIETNPTKKQYPWKAALSFNQANSTKTICQAILISPSYLITPAHCVTFRKEETAVPNDSLLVHLGDSIQAKLSDVTAHPGYQAGFLDHDLAILKTTVPLEVTDHVRPICLFDNEVREGRELAFVVGNEIGKKETVAQENVEAAAFRIDQGECEQMNPKLKDILGENTYCVSYLPDNKHCVGSSGDGFISSKDERSILRGVVSLGLSLQGGKECKESSVSIVTDIAKYKNWIYRIIYQ